MVNNHYYPLTRERVSGERGCLVQKKAWCKNIVSNTEYRKIPLRRGTSEFELNFKRFKEGTEESK